MASSQRAARRIAASTVILGTLAAGCGTSNSDDKPVAFVADRVVTKGQLDAALEHLREEAIREGRTPELGDPDSRAARNHLLVLLVYRAQLDEAAARLHIHVSEEQVDARVAELAESKGEEAEKDDEFARSTARAQVVYGEIYNRVTRNVRVSDFDVKHYLRAAGIPNAKRATVGARLLADKRNRTMRRWIIETDRRLAPRIHYAPGYTPVG